MPHCDQSCLAASAAAANSACQPLCVHARACLCDSHTLAWLSVPRCVSRSVAEDIRAYAVDAHPVDEHSADHVSTWEGG